MTLQRTPARTRHFYCATQVLNLSTLSRIGATFNGQHHPVTVFIGQRLDSEILLLTTGASDVPGYFRPVKTWAGCVATSLPQVLVTQLFATTTSIYAHSYQDPRFPGTIQHLCSPISARATVLGPGEYPLVPQMPLPNKNTGVPNSPLFASENHGTAENRTPSQLAYIVKGTPTDSKQASRLHTMQSTGASVPTPTILTWSDFRRQDHYTYDQ